MVCRLGGFRTLMSFLGSIADSGVQQTLALVYSPNTIRGLFLFDSALVYKVFSELDQPRDYLQTFETIMGDAKQIDDIDNDEIDQFQSVVAELKDKHRVSRTARYWFQYMDYMQVVKVFSCAERTGDWNLHLHAIYKMLNLFSVTGHLHYAKSAEVYLQRMLDLPFECLNIPCHL